MVAFCFLFFFFCGFLFSRSFFFSCSLLVCQVSPLPRSSLPYVRNSPSDVCIIGNFFFSLFLLLFLNFPVAFLHCLFYCLFSLALHLVFTALRSSPFVCLFVCFVSLIISRDFPLNFSRAFDLRVFHRQRLPSQSQRRT